MTSPKAIPDELPTDPEQGRPGGLGWLSIAGIALVAVLLTVHVANRWDVRATAAAPTAASSIAKPAPIMFRAPS